MKNGLTSTASIMKTEHVVLPFVHDEQADLFQARCSCGWKTAAYGGEMFYSIRKADHLRDKK